MGKYLGLVEPDGVTIASEFTPTFPTQVGDISYGTSEDIVTTQLLSSGTTGKLLVPSGDIGNGWTATNYNGSRLTNVSTGIGFDSTASGRHRPGLFEPNRTKRQPVLEPCFRSGFYGQPTDFDCPTGRFR